MVGVRKKRRKEAIGGEWSGTVHGGKGKGGAAGREGKRGDSKAKWGKRRK